MKKILTSIVALLMLSSLSFGQAAAPNAQKAKSTAKTQAAPAKTQVKATTANAKTQAPAAASTAKADAHLKKDGTPDKRFKDNKNAPAGPLKKDGTPDMRYKANKAAAKK